MDDEYEYAYRVIYVVGEHSIGHGFEDVIYAVNGHMAHLINDVGLDEDVVEQAAFEALDDLGWDAGDVLNGAAWLDA